MSLNFQHKKIFFDIRNHLAGTVVGKTRDNELLNEITKILYVKSYFKPKKLNGSAANFYQDYIIFLKIQKSILQIKISNLLIKRLTT